MQLNRSYWMAAVMMGVCGAGLQASAASNPTTSAFRVNCTTQACSGLSGSFGGRIDWYSGNVLLASESGTFLAIGGGDILATLSGNGNQFTFKATYLDPAGSIFAGPDLNFKLFDTDGGDNLLLAEPWQPQASATWVVHSEDAAVESARATAAEGAEKARALAAESALNVSLVTEVSKRSSGDQSLTILNNTEVSRAKNAETSLQAAIDAEAAARKAADTTETMRASAAETVLTNSLNTEISRAQTAEQNILNTSQSQLSSMTSVLMQETSDRMNGDQNLQNQLNNEINRATGAEPSITPSANAHTDSRTPWPASCPQGQIIVSTGPNTWACGDLKQGGGACASFPSSSLISADQATQINTWIGTPGQLWKRCYSRNVDGGDSTSFHAACDNLGVAVTVVKGDTGAVWGGYASPDWESNGSYYGDNSSFLFSLTNSAQYMHGTGIAGNDPYEMFGYLFYGPTWGGANDWQTNQDMTTGYCALGYSYGCRVGSWGDDGTCTRDMCGVGFYQNFNLTDLEVWVHDANPCQDACGGANLQTDPNNCGQCGNVCPANMPMCMAGACSGGGMFVGIVNVGDLYQDADPFTEHNTACSNQYNGAHQCTYAEVVNNNLANAICADGVGYIIVNDKNLASFQNGYGWLYYCDSCYGGGWGAICNGQPVPCCD